MLPEETVSGADPAAGGVAPTTAAEARRLLQGFEPLGATDIFGQVQRAAGIEQFGLLSFAAISLDALIAALDSDFAGVGTPEQTRLLPESTGYVLEDARFGFRIATGINPAQVPAAQVYVNACRQLQSSAARLLERIRAADRVFVYTAPANETPERLLHLSRALARHGGARLLAVQPSADPAQAGRVTRLGPTAMLGRILPQTTLESWVTLCRRTAELAAVSMQTVSKTPRSRLGFFDGTELPLADDFQCFYDATHANGPDLCYLHAYPANRCPPAGDLVRNKTWFGPGQPCQDWIMTDASVHMAGVETVSLKDAVLLNRYITIFSPERGIYRPSATGFSLQSLAKADPWFTIDPDGGVTIPLLHTIDHHECIGIPICGVGFNNYGHFLLDGLPLAMFMVERLRDHAAYLIGPPLAEWQTSILDALDLTGRYLALTEPRRFRRIVASSLLDGHVGSPTRFARLVFDRIRLRLGLYDRGHGRRIFIRRPHHPERRYLENISDVEACFRRANFEILQPDTLSFPEQVRAFATASVVAGEYGAAMANVGFCDPGTKVLEIVPDTHFDNWVRGMCLVFSHRWHVYFARVETPATGQDRDAFRYRVDIEALEEAIHQIL